MRTKWGLSGDQVEALRACMAGPVTELILLTGRETP